MRRPRWLYTWPLRLRSLVRTRTVDAELDEELRYHLEEDAAAFAARGLSATDARTAARRKFGGVEQLREACRDTRGLAALESLQQDLRYGARMLGRSPGFTLVAAATLAIGIGANTAIFSLVDGILFRPLPYPAPDRLVTVTGTYPRGAFVAMREQARTADLGAYVADQSLMLTGVGDAVRLNGAAVSTELFSILGARPAAGRLFRAHEDLAGQDQIVILSHTLWQQRFGSDRTIVGRTIALDGVRRVVVGVMPASFAFPTRAAQLWVPLHLDARRTPHYWAGDFMPIVGRLRPEATLAAAHAEIRVFQTRVRALFPWRMPEQWNADVTVIPLQHGLVAGVETRLLILLGAVALVLLIACANVANLTLSRAAGREREIGVRAALGAAPRRIARQMLTESVLLSALGGIAGLLVAAQALAILKLALPADTPRLEDVQMNWRVLLFTAAVSLATGCLFGLAPVLHARRAALFKAMASGGRGGATSLSERLRASLAVAEVAMAVLLVAAAGLLVRSLWTLAHVDPGFRPEQVVTARVTPGDSVCGDVTRCLAFYRTLEDQTRAAPGVSGVALVNTLPLGGAVTKRSLQLEDYQPPPTDTEPLFWLKVVTPDYFRVMGIRLESGRAFADADRAGNPAVAIVTAATAQRYWPGQSPLGKHVRFIGETGWREVVGVVADVRAYDITHTVPDWIKGMVYVPHSTRATLEDGRLPTELTLTVRTASSEAQMGSLLRRLVSRASPDAAVSDVRAMSTVVADAVSTPTSTASLFATFAGVALLLGSIGVYGVLSFLVSRRTRDIGIRLALGAQRRDVSWLVLREGVRFAGLGIGLGLAAALVLTRLLTSELYGVSALDPLTYAGVTLVVSLVSLAASYLPARRATRVDPLVALRDG
jgi:predicted permease